MPRKSFSTNETSPKGPSRPRVQEPDLKPNEVKMIDWAWAAMLLAEVYPVLEDGTYSSEPVLKIIAPTTEGLEALERSKSNVMRLWVLAAWPNDPQWLRLESIEEVCTWTTTTPEGRHLSVLRRKGGELLAVEDSELFMFCSISSDWQGVGRYVRFRRSVEMEQNSSAQ